MAKKLLKSVLAIALSAMLVVPGVSVDAKDAVIKTANLSAGAVKELSESAGSGEVLDSVSSEKYVAIIKGTKGDHYDTTSSLTITNGKTTRVIDPFEVVKSRLGNHAKIQFYDLAVANNRFFLTGATFSSEDVFDPSTKVTYFILSTKNGKNVTVNKLPNLHHGIYYEDFSVYYYNGSYIAALDIMGTSFSKKGKKLPYSYYTSTDLKNWTKRTIPPTMTDNPVDPEATGGDRFFHPQFANDYGFVIVERIGSGANGDWEYTPQHKFLLTTDFVNYSPIDSLNKYIINNPEKVLDSENHKFKPGVKTTGILSFGEGNSALVRIDYYTSKTELYDYNIDGGRFCYAVNGSDFRQVAESDSYLWYTADSAKNGSGVIALLYGDRIKVVTIDSEGNNTGEHYLNVSAEKLSGITLDDKGNIFLVANDSSILVSKDNGATFREVRIGKSGVSGCIIAGSKLIVPMSNSKDIAISLKNILQ